MIVVTSVTTMKSAPLCVAPVNDLMKSLVNWAYTEKAFDLQVERIKKAASKVKRVKLCVSYYKGRSFSLIDDKRLRVFGIIYLHVIDDILVEDKSGEVKPYLCKATQALYDMAEKCDAASADENEDPNF